MPEQNFTQDLSSSKRRPRRRIAGAVNDEHPGSGRDSCSSCASYLEILLNTRFDDYRAYLLRSERYLDKKPSKALV